MMNYADKLKGLPGSWEKGRLEAQHWLDKVRLHNASLLEVRDAERALIAYPKTVDEAQARWEAARAVNLARAEPLRARPTSSATISWRWCFA